MAGDREYSRGGGWLNDSLLWRRGIKGGQIEKWGEHGGSVVLNIALQAEIKRWLWRAVKGRAVDLNSR